MPSMETRIFSGRLMTEATSAGKHNSEGAQPKGDMPSRSITPKPNRASDHYTNRGPITPGGKGAVKVWVDSPTENNSAGMRWTPVQPVAPEGHDRLRKHLGRR